MSDALIIIAAWIIGSVVWLAIQIAWNFLFVTSRTAYDHTRACIMIGLIGGPVFVLGVYTLLKIWDHSTSWTEMMVMILCAGWVCLLAWAGLHISARMRGLFKDEALSKK